MHDSIILKMDQPKSSIKLQIQCRIKFFSHLEKSITIGKRRCLQKL